MMTFVLLESPHAGNVEENEKYARECMRDSLTRGEAPFASHLLYTQCLDDLDPIERSMGIEAGLKVGSYAEKTVVYTDLGISRGMHYGIDDAIKKKRPIEYRKIR